MSMFNVFGYLDDVVIDVVFDCPRKLEESMKEVDKKFEKGEFKFGFLDVYNHETPVRGFTWGYEG